MKNGRPPIDRTGDKPGTRICNKCKQSLPIESFSKDSNRYDKLRVTCKECDKKSYDLWIEENPSKFIEKKRKNAGLKNIWAKNNREEANSRNRNQRKKERKILVEHYGGKCACCGESRIEFLAIDHIDGGGTAHREKVGKGQRFYAWLKREGFPEGFRILCHNCNLAIGFYGYCPHTLPTYDETTYTNGDTPSPTADFYAKRTRRKDK